MERRTKRMLLAVLMILSVLATDFFVLGSGIMTYASELSSETNNTYIEFSTYFKEGENRVDSIERSIKDKDVRLYAEIKVKNEGYLKEGTVIELENSNFNLKGDILSSNTHINGIDGNKVSLKQINNGENVEIELGIEPAIADKITTEYLSKTSIVKMIGIYVYSKAEEGKSIRADKEVAVNYQPDETLAAELDMDIITNKILEVGGVNQRIVQFLIKSRLTNNEYPIKETILTATVPKLSDTMPEIKAMAKDELASNGTTNISSITTENGVEIILKNEPNENQQINWNKNVYDEIIVTYMYPETVDASKIEITTNSEIKIYNSEKTYKEQTEKCIENQELNNVIIGKSEITTEEIYKGKIYANLETRYKTETSIVITNSDVVEEVITIEGPDTYGVETSEIDANTKYISTEINLEDMLEIVGQEGNIEIKNGETVTLVNKESQVDENGNVIINHQNETAELQVTTSKPVKEGILKLRHTKAITKNEYGYTRQQLQQVNTINAKGYIEGNITANKEKQKIISNSMETTSLELKETKSKAEISIENNKKNLSTTEENELTLGISLITDGEQYDLFKNPKINLKFPSSVEKVELITESIKQNADEFAVYVGSFDTINKTMLIDLQGEQTAYPESELIQGYIQLNLKITLNSLALAQTDKIIMSYTNENANQYENEVNGMGVVEQVIQISAPSQLIKTFNISSSENTSYTETILEKVKESEAGKTLDYTIKLRNNKSSNMRNIKIIGKLPTTGITIGSEDENTLETILKGIRTENATIYYTENINATEDIEDATNRWTQDLTTLANAKMYLIKVETIERGETFQATVKVQLPTSIPEDVLSYTQYEVIYDIESETKVKESSRKIGLATLRASNIETNVTAQVGQDILKSGDTVKEGEVIKYTITVKNNETKTLENVQLKLNVPEGTTYVKGINSKMSEDGMTPEYSEGTDEYIDYVEYVEKYYKEITDREELEELTEIIIETLDVGQSYTTTYEVRVNKGTKGTNISNKSTVNYKELSIKCEELKNRVEEANIRVAIKRTLDESIPLYPGTESRYAIIVENLSNTTIKNLELEIIANGFFALDETKNEQLKGKIIIDEIAPKDENNKGYTIVGVYGMIASDTERMSISTIVKDSEGRKYRSNIFSAELPHLGATISMTSPQQGKYIQEGDFVEYNINIKNTGSEEAAFGLKDNIPIYLHVQSISINNEIVLQKSAETNISNYIYHTISLKPQEKLKVDIIAKVGYIEEIYNGETITNVVLIDGINVAESSNVVTHVLKAQQSEKVENIISGYAWLDSDGDGQRNSFEGTLSGVRVKIYDTLSNHYVSNEDGNVIEIITDNNGEYNFKNVKNGSYLIIFEYDTEKYEFTTSYAEGVDTTLNSKVSLKYIKSNEKQIRVAAIELNNLSENVFNMNIGLKRNTGETPKEEQPGMTDLPSDTGKPEQSEETKNYKKVSGFAWLDLDRNGQKDSKETTMEGIKVKLYNVSKRNFVADRMTDANGKYVFNNVEKGAYIIVFEYDTDEYELTTYFAEGVHTTLNSKVIVKKINVNGQEILAAVTDIINVQEDVSDINIGLKEKLIFDLELDKYISKIVVQTSKETKTYNYENNTFEKVEIHRKQIQGALVVLEYTIKVKNTGEISGYATNIVDYIPKGLTFSSELNKDWYLLEGNLYTKSLENVELNPGEEKEVKLILTKTMTNNNVGLINNRAEIYQDYNKYGDSDIDSIPNNQVQTEDDYGTTDVIIQVATGGSSIMYTILLMVNIVLIYIAIRIMIKNDIIKIKND